MKDIPDQEPKKWFILNAVLINNTGEIGGQSALMPGEDEQEVRMKFLDALLAQHSATGFAIKAVSVSPIIGLTIIEDTPIVEAVEQDDT